MRYVRRDASGAIVALSLEPLEGFVELEQGAPVPAALESAALQQERLRETDMEVVRVLDDLINLLVEKNTIRFTDLPEAAQRKLMERRGLRRTGSHLGLLGDEDTSLF